MSFTNITNLNGITISFRTRKREDIKKVLLNPAIVAVFIGLIIMIFGFDIPSVLSSTLDLVGNIINVYLPSKYKRNGNVGIVKLAIEKMYHEIARVEIENVMEETRIKMNGLAPENYVIRRIPNKLAKTIDMKTIVINPEIVKYDKKVLKYVVLHEFCHLKYKTHSKGFFEMMERYMEDYDYYDCILNVA